MRDPKGRQAATLRAQWLGERLRQLRQARGVTMREAGEYLQRDFTALSRFENADWPVPVADVIQLLTLYGVADPKQRDAMTQLCEEIWRKDEWFDAEEGARLYDPSFINVPWLEQRADRICSFNLTSLHGLMQTADYAEALIQFLDGPGASQSQIARWVQLRMDRQGVLDGPRPTRLAMVIAEGALRNPVGGSAVMRAQLEHLGQLVRKPHIELRVLPPDIGAHAGMEGTFRIFELPKPYPKVAYTETLAGRMFIEAPRSDRFVRAYDRLREAALNASESAKLIESIAEDMR